MAKKSSESLEEMLKLAKSDISTHVKIRMLQTAPEWSMYITRRLIIDTHIFIDGFGSCLKEYIKPPYNEDEIKEFLKEESFRYIFKRIESDQKDS